MSNMMPNYSCGPCAAQLSPAGCPHPEMELRPTHLCVDCGQILHAFCAQLDGEQARCPYPCSVKAIDNPDGQEMAGNNQDEDDDKLHDDSTSTDDPSSTRTRTTRKRYSNKEKVRILEMLTEPGMNLASISRREGIAEGTIRGWKKLRDELNNKASKSGSDQKKANRTDFLERISASLVEFLEFNNRTSDPLPVTASIIQDRAVQARDKLLEEHQKRPFLADVEVKAYKDFMASETWAKRWARDRKLKLRAKAVDQATQANVAAAELQTIRQQLSQYESELVYNMTEMELNYKLLPNRSSFVRGYRSGRGRRKNLTSDSRATIYVCANEAGNHKLPLVLISSDKEDPNGDIMHHYQANAWSNTSICSSWWTTVFLPQIRARTSEKVLLILHNSGADLVDPQAQVKVAFLPATILPPLAAGVLNSMKENYRYSLLRKILEIFDDRRDRRKAAKELTGVKGLKEGHTPHLKECMTLLKDVWESQTSKMILQNAWSRSNIRPGAPPPEDPDNVDPDAIELLLDLQGFLNNTMADGRDELDIVKGENELDDLVLSMRESLEGLDDEELMDSLIDWVELEDTDEYKTQMAREARDSLDNLFDDFVEQQRRQKFVQRGQAAPAPEQEQNDTATSSSCLGSDEILQVASSLQQSRKLLSQSGDKEMQALSVHCGEMADKVFSTHRKRKRKEMAKLFSIFSNNK